MTEEHLIAVRKLREEANNLRLACTVAAKSGSLVHIAYDRDLAGSLPIDQTVLLGKLRAIQ